MISKVRKRDGRIQDFNPEKITSVVHKALKAGKKKDGKLAPKLSEQVLEILNHYFSGKVPSVEDIQDVVEEVLIKNKLSKVAKAYILYRSQHEKIREVKEFFGVKDDLKLGINAIKVLQKRYLLKDGNGKTIETPSQLFRRVAHTVAAADKFYGKNEKEVKKLEEKFYKSMSNLEFLPNSPTLMNAGTELGQLAACFVLPVEDSIDSIFKTLWDAAVIHKSGGGTGFNFTKLRPAGDFVRTTGGIASGPLSFMKIFDTMTEEIKQGGKRRGANMGILNYKHPDILYFINSKLDSKNLPNFNISIGVTDEFMEAVERSRDIELKNPRTKEVMRKINAKELFDMIVMNAWKTGDPGLIFLDEINRTHPASHVGVIESTNPCGEVPLLPYEQCVLGSINLQKFVKGKKVDWKKLKKTIELGVHFLDNVIDVTKYPIPEIEQMAKANRKIGLGVMGFAEMLVQFGISYNSQKALKFAEQLMRFIEKESHRVSQKTGKERGDFPNFKGSLWEKKKYRHMRNATVTAIAPTGTISIIAGCSSGIEPLFAISFVRNVMEGTRLLEVTAGFEQIAKKKKIFSTELLMRIAETGSIQNVPNIPEDIKKIFVTALDIPPDWHVRMQAAFQKYTDNAVSKTINLPEKATQEDVRSAYLLAYKLKCKGITVYRYGSKEDQVLTIGTLEKGLGENHVVAESEFSGGSFCVICPH